MTRTEKQTTRRRIDEARQNGLELVLAAYPDIVAKLAEVAKTGSCPHAKLVFELMQPAPHRAADEDDENESEASFAEFLVEQLQLRDPNAPGEGRGPKVSAAQDLGNPSAASTGIAESV